MIQVTRWKPDTCGCVIDYEWDDSLPLEEREIQVKSVVKCDEHKSNTKQETFDNVLDENQSKNKTYGKIIEEFPELVVEKVTEQGDISKDLKPEISFDWSFDENRNLEVDVKGMTPEQKTKLRELVMNDTEIKNTDIK
jgi:hypothetical protein